MKCVCDRTCQVRKRGAIVFCLSGEVHEFDKCPDHFSPIEGEKAELVNFLKAGESELMESTWTFEEAYTAIFKAFNKELTKEEGTKKSEVVAQILDIRFRAIDIDPNKVV